MDKLKRDTALGVVFFAGLGLLLWATQELSGFQFEEKQVIRAEFANARGLRTGEQVIVHPPDTLADGQRVEPRA